jgi:hypothetical protein
MAGVHKAIARTDITTWAWPGTTGPPPSGAIWTAGHTWVGLLVLAPLRSTAPAPVQETEAIDIRISPIADRRVQF